jgi:hypothetical protein
MLVPFAREPVGMGPVIMAVPYDARGNMVGITRQVSMFMVPGLTLVATGS